MKLMENPRLLRVESADLNGDAFIVPDSFTAPRTLLLLAFEREHQALIDTWSRGLELSPDDCDWFELPIVKAPGFLARKLIDIGMRSGIRAQNQRARIVTLYTNGAEILKPLGWSDTATIYAVVVTPTGEVCAQVEGGFDEAKARIIREAWRIG